MSGRFDYHFEWDPAKAAGNRHKHGVGFELAATVFRDRLVLSRFDDEHNAFDIRNRKLKELCRQVDGLQTEDQEIICRFLDMAVRHNKLQELVGGPLRAAS